MWVRIIIICFDVENPFQYNIARDAVCLKRASQYLRINSLAPHHTTLRSIFRLVYAVARVFQINIEKFLSDVGHGDEISHGGKTLGSV